MMHSCTNWRRCTPARYIDGAETPPLDVFLAAVDIVLLASDPGAGRG